VSRSRRIATAFHRRIPHHVVQSLGNHISPSSLIGSPASSLARSQIHLPLGSSFLPLDSLSTTYMQQTALPMVPTSSLTCAAADFEISVYLFSSEKRMSRYLATPQPSPGSTRKPDLSGWSLGNNKEILAIFRELLIRINKLSKPKPKSRKDKATTKVFLVKN
jgi:hypothetical protein